MSMGKITRKKMFLDKSSLWSFIPRIFQKEKALKHLCFNTFEMMIKEKYFALDSTTPSKIFKNITTDQKTIT